LWEIGVFIPSGSQFDNDIPEPSRCRGNPFWTFLTPVLGLQPEHLPWHNEGVSREIAEIRAYEARRGEANNSVPPRVTLADLWCKVICVMPSAWSPRSADGRYVPSVCAQQKRRRRSAAQVALSQCSGLTLRRSGVGINPHERADLRQTEHHSGHRYAEPDSGGHHPWVAGLCSKREAVQGRARDQGADDSRPRVLADLTAQLVADGELRKL
jgi:hypothetical protein